ncbi:unnamed protein product, partial [Prorocentrum cordatum]
RRYGGASKLMGHPGSRPLLDLLPDEFQVHYSEDQSGCFHLYRVPRAWRGSFVIEEATPGPAFGFPDSARARPRMRTCPMGWVSAFDFTQEAHANLITRQLPHTMGLASLGTCCGRDPRPAPAGTRAPWNWFSIYVGRWGQGKVALETETEQCVFKPSGEPMSDRAARAAAGAWRALKKSAEGFSIWRLGELRPGPECMAWLTSLLQGTSSVTSSVVAGAIGGLAAGGRCDCHCEVAAAPDQGLLQLLQRQLDRCGPEQLHGQVCRALPPPPVATLALIGVGLFFAGVVFGSVLVICSRHAGWLAPKRSAARAYSLWHGQLRGVRSGPSPWVGATPSGSDHDEDLMESDGSPRVGPLGCLQAGAANVEVFRFAYLTTQEKRELLEAREDHVRDIEGSHDIEAAVGQALAGQAWVATESCHGFTHGQADDLAVCQSLASGDRGALTVPNVWALFVVMAGSLSAGAGEGDLGTPPVRFDRSNPRFGGCGGAVVCLSETVQAGWAVAGPRTCKWILHGIRDAGWTPTRRQVGGRNLPQVSHGDAGVEEHAYITEVLERACVFDQPNCTELEAFVVLSWRYQLSEALYAPESAILTEKVKGGEEKRLAHGATAGRAAAASDTAPEAHFARGPLRETSPALLRPQPAVVGSGMAFGPQPPDGRPRGLLPFPGGRALDELLLGAAGGGLSAAGERKARRRRGEEARLRAGLGALSELGGGGSAPGIARATAAQASAVRSLAKLYGGRGPPPADVDSGVADSFDATYQPGRISLPQSRAGAAPLCDVAPNDLQCTLAEGSGLLRDPAEVQAALRELGPAMALDPALRLRGFMRGRFPAELLDKGILEKATVVKETSGAFFVKRKGGLLRWRKRLGLADVECAFQARVVPMGWSWAVHFIQRAHEYLLSSRAPSAPWVRDKVPAAPACEGPSKHCYIDNLSVASDEECEAMNGIAHMPTTLEGVGAKAHLDIPDPSSGSLELLGFEYAAGATPSGLELERLIGHLVSMMTLRRDLLSVLSAVYQFSRKLGRRRAPLWPSAQRELSWAHALLPTIVARSDLQWLPVVTAYDASEWGLGVAESLWGSADVGRAGRLRERARVRGLLATAGGSRREHALHDEEELLRLPDAAALLLGGHARFQEVPRELLLGGHQVAGAAGVRAGAERRGRLPSQAQYTRAMKELADWPAALPRPEGTASTWGKRQSDSLSVRLDRGGGPHAVRSTPPLAYQAAAGWARLRPPQSRPPIPRLVSAGLAGSLFAPSKLLMGHLIVLLCVTCRLPGAGLALLGRQVIGPIAGMPGVLGQVIFVLRSDDLGAPSRTNLGNSHAALGLPEHRRGGRALLERTEQRATPQRLFPIVYGELLAEQKRAAVAAGRGALCPTPPGPRHGGASLDRARGLRFGGKWRPPPSTQRREMHARISKQLERLHPRVLLDLHSLEGKVFLEVFAGAGHLGQALRRRGAAVMGIDVRRGPRRDLRAQKVVSVVNGWILSGLAWRLWLGTPCSGFSGARRAPAGSRMPAALRSPQQPRGLSGLPPRDAAKLADGSALADRAGQLARPALERKIPGGEENPAQSFPWALRSRGRFLAQLGVFDTVIDYCAFGRDF